MKISVCMATYNGELYIKEQVESILEQLSNDDELIISDDHSTDKTISILKSINDQRIIIAFNERKKGYTHNFENALNIARGDYIFISDQDDIWIEGKVTAFIDAFSDGFDFIISDSSMTDASLKIISQSRIEEYNIKGGFINNLIKTRYLGCCMAFNQKVLHTILPFPSNDSLCPHDLWITLVSELYFRCTIINRPLIFYRRHNHNVSNAGNTSSRSLIKKIVGRLYCLCSVIKIAPRFIKVLKKSMEGIW